LLLLLLMWLLLLLLVWGRSAIFCCDLRHAAKESNVV
jgi:hypothetical protein